MTSLTELRRAALEIFDEALKSVDARLAVRRAVHLEGSRLRVVNTTINLSDGGKRVYAVALGKAARPMAHALTEILGERLTGGVITAPPSDTSLPDRWRVFAGGHPLPNQESLAAARAAFELVGRADAESAALIFLISGGGSAMMEWPRDERITLEELRSANEALVSCGANIAEINAVRRAVSAIKGGGLSLRAQRCEQVSLIVSDTGAGREGDVASGPTFAPPADAPDAAAVVARYKLEAALPESILRAIGQPAAGTKLAAQLISSPYYVLLDNESALKSAARAARERGFVVEFARDIVEQPIAEGCSILLSRLLDLWDSVGGEDRGVCLISGGEFACPVRGSGTGGRNAESALRWAIEMDSRSGSHSGPSHLIALSAGTDGVDGNSPGAGAIADETTLRRARQLGLDARRFLDESDAYTFFHRLNDAIVTGPTATNVRDVRIMLAG
ncbi:MAG TPA: DUF4147 domain-containing protein [Pyrinomonadaceae bacterium]|nr:DUF4147 domain-containing protein [Pyrinomonadaceae bacterium]